MVVRVKVHWDWTGLTVTERVATSLAIKSLFSDIFSVGGLSSSEEGHSILSKPMKFHFCLYQKREWDNRVLEGKMRMWGIQDFMDAAYESGGNAKWRWSPGRNVIWQGWQSGTWRTSASGPQNTEPTYLNHTRGISWEFLMRIKQIT